MKTTLIEESKGNQTAYNSLMVKPKDIGVICSDLSLKIINELVRTPSCAMDVARKLEQHEQKIYYHLRRLENVGIIKLVASEKRYGMTAKIYDVVSPIIATKLYNDGYSIKNSDLPAQNPEIVKFLHPFIVDGKLNAKIIIGDPYSHGKYDSGAKEGPFTFDLALFLGNFLNEAKFPYSKLDTYVRGNDLKNNLILIGNAKTNTIIEKLNSELPVYFDPKKAFAITIKSNNQIYKDPRNGVILKCDNPLAKDKKILLIGGVRSRGTHAAIIALTQNTQKVVNGENNDEVVKMVVGYDREGDSIIDSVKFLE